jgi:hypothetical protein
VKSTGFLVLAALGLLCAMAAVGDDEGDQTIDGQHKGMCRNMPAFKDVDADADGSIVAEEFYAMRSRHMAERAREGGKLRNAANAPTFEDLDKDGDGKVNPEEFAGHHAEMKGRHRGSPH